MTPPDLPLTLAVLACLAGLVLVLIMPTPDHDRDAKPADTACENRYAPHHSGKVMHDRATGKYLCGGCWQRQPVTQWDGRRKKR